MKSNLFFTVIITMLLLGVQANAQDVITKKNESKDVVNEPAAGTHDKQQQSIQSELSYKNGVLLHDSKIKPDQVRKIMSVNSEALRQYNSGRSLFIAGQIIAYPGACLLGYDLGTRIAGSKGNNVILGVGAAGMAVGLIMGFSGEKKMKTAVQLYNSKENKDVFYQINFGLTQTGVGLSMRF